MRTLALAFAALVLPMAAAQASMAAAVAPTARRAADPFVATCNTRKWGQSKKLPFNQRTEFCCAHWGFDKRKSQKNCDSVYTAYRGLAAKVVNETLAALSIGGGSSGQSGIGGGGASISSVAVDSTNPSQIIVTFSDGTTYAADLSGLKINGAITGASLNGTTLQITTQGGQVYPVDLSSLSGSGGAKISGIAVDPANATQVIITYTDGSSQTVDGSALGRGKGLAGLAYDKTTNEIVATLVDGTTVKGSLADLLAAASATGVSGLGLSGSNLVLTLGNGTQLTQDLSSLSGGSGGKTISSVGIDPANTTQLVITYSDGTTTKADLSGLTTGKTLTGLAYDPATKSLVATLADGTKVTAGLSQLLADASGNGVSGLGLSGTKLVVTLVNGTQLEQDLASLSGSGGAPVAGGGTGLDSAVTDGVRKRCPMVGGVQQVLRNAFCWCANAAGTGFATGNQGAIKGVMWQKPSTAGAAVGTAAVPCDEANPNSCIQAECQVTKEGNNWRK